MTPVLLGRIQTRLFVWTVVGLPWALLVTPLLGLPYALTLVVWTVTTVVGCAVWEPLCHLAMQLRWEKDWPAFLHLLQGLPECLTTYLLLRVGAPGPLSTASGEADVPVVAYLALFTTTWTISWLAANGPMKIFFVRWRYSGGRLV